MKLKYVYPDHKVKDTSFMVSKSNPTEEEQKAINVWLPRNGLNSAMYDHVTSAHGDSVKV